MSCGNVHNCILVLVIVDGFSSILLVWRRLGHHSKSVGGQRSIERWTGVWTIKEGKGISQTSSSTYTRTTARKSMVTTHKQRHCASHEPRCNWGAHIPARLNVPVEHKTDVVWRREQPGQAVTTKGERGRK